jgi:hypothetical protein
LVVVICGKIFTGNHINHGFSPSNIVVSEVSCSSFPSNPMSHGSDVWFNGLKTCRGSYVVLLKKFWVPVSLRSSKYDGKDYVQNRGCFSWCFRSLKSSGLLTSASPKLFFMLLPGGMAQRGWVPGVQKNW